MRALIIILLMLPAIAQAQPKPTKCKLLIQENIPDDSAYETSYIEELWEDAISDINEDPRGGIMTDAQYPVKLKNFPKVTVTDLLKELSIYGTKVESGEKALERFGKLMMVKPYSTDGEIRLPYEIEDEPQYVEGVDAFAQLKFRLMDELGGKIKNIILLKEKSKLQRRDITRINHTLVIVEDNGWAYSFTVSDVESK
jgi:hypothetical protein